MSNFTIKALKLYETTNKKLPGRIVVYRDGVGGPAMQKRVLEVELGKMTEAIQAFKAGY